MGCSQRLTHTRRRSAFRYACGTSDQATPTSVLAHEKDYADNQAAANAEIMRAYAQAILELANATLSAALIQQQNSADVVAAQLTAAAFGLARLISK